jgi:hypothetical protein
MPHVLQPVPPTGQVGTAVLRLILFQEVHTRVFPPFLAGLQAKWQGIVSFFRVFIYGLFNDPVISYDYIAQNYL